MSRTGTSEGRRSGPLAWVERMGLRPLLGLLMEALDVRLQLSLVHAPHASPADLDGGKLSGANQRVDLGDADAEVGGDVLERKKAGLDEGSVAVAMGAAPGAHAPKIAPSGHEILDLTLFALV